MKKLQEQDDKLTNIGETLSNASNEIVKKLKQENEEWKNKYEYLKNTINDKTNENKKLNDIINEKKH